MIGDEVAITPFAVGIIVGPPAAASRLGWLLVHVTTGVDRSSELAEIQAATTRRLNERRVLSGNSARTSNTTLASRCGGRPPRHIGEPLGQESRDVKMTASDGRVALRGICACTIRISEEEVRDFCSVLSLAGRVVVAGSADATLAPLFRLSLAEFGFDAHVLDTTTVGRVEPADTVVALAGSALLLRQADAAITVPWTAGSESMRKGSAEEVFELMSLVTTHAIRRELTRRCSRDYPPGAAVDGFSHPAEHLSALIPHSNTARGSTI